MNQAIKMVVACLDIEAQPDFYTCVVSVSSSQYAAGSHYDLAKESAVRAGFHGPMVAFDAIDLQHGKRIAPIAQWLAEK